MSKSVDDSALDALLNAAAAATELYLCTGDPADRTAARAASLTDTTTPETPPTTTGPQNGTPNGREIVYNALVGLVITVTGPAQADTVCLCSGTTLLLKTDLATALTGLVQNDTVDLTAFTHNVADPT